MLYRSCPADAIPPILVVPLGTANLMGKHLGMDWQEENFAEHAVRAIQRRQIVHLQMSPKANAKLFSADGRRWHRCGNSSTNWIESAAGRSIFWSYALPAALGARRITRIPALSVEADGELVFPVGPRYTLGWQHCRIWHRLPDPCRMQKSDDGLLDLCVMPCANRREALDLALRAAASEHLQVEGVIYRNAKQIRIKTIEPVPIQLDGDSAGYTPLEVKLLPVRMPFIVP